MHSSCIVYHLPRLVSLSSSLISNRLWAHDVLEERDRLRRSLEEAGFDWRRLGGVRSSWWSVGALEDLLERLQAFLEPRTSVEDVGEVFAPRSTHLV